MKDVINHLQRTPRLLSVSNADAPVEKTTYFNFQPNRQIDAACSGRRLSSEITSQPIGSDIETAPSHQEKCALCVRHDNACMQNSDATMLSASFIHMLPPLSWIRLRGNDSPRNIKIHSNLVHCRCFVAYCSATGCIGTITTVTKSPFLPKALHKAVFTSLHNVHMADATNSSMSVVRSEGNRILMAKC